MEIRRALMIVAAIAAIVLVIIGILDVDLFIAIWSKVLVVAVIVCISLALVRMLFPPKTM